MRFVDEHSNNTSNNEEGIVNISSFKKNISSKASPLTCPPTPTSIVRENCN